eukprot:CAMPEP_0194280286 /NCGR_PEP_ID=MMETSP0169-20130528/16786_1 /TAXON_ID=218684 /ORGANISM="Corethron pennatum, Strain L29A3" /LENGTH=241 /DNA_ID=CAMNT_0039024951 /DNA_START=37 /DNA_END=759 /DNA_ORIENTATION=+
MPAAPKAAMPRTSAKKVKKNMPAAPKAAADVDLDAATVLAATQALLAYQERSSSSNASGKATLPGLTDDADVHLVITLDRPPPSPSSRPRIITVPHPILTASDANDGEGAAVLLLVKDDAAKDLVRAVLDAAGPDHRVMSQVRKVLTLDSLRTKHQRFANKRELAAEYDVVLVDVRILPMAGKALGRAAMTRGLKPIPLRIRGNGAGLPVLIKRALAGTYLTVPAGTCATLQVGTVRMGAE